MSAWLSLVIGAALGAFVSLVAAVYLQDRWKESSDRRRRLRRSRAITKSWLEEDGPITVAGILTSVYLVEGDGHLVIEPKNIRVDIRSTRAELPAVVSAAREKLVRQLASFYSKRQAPGISLEQREYGCSQSLLDHADRGARGFRIAPGSVSQ